MIALADSRSEAAVRAVIESWIALLVAGRTGEALALLVPSERWTPELLDTVVRHYGFIEPRRDGKTFSVTPIASAVGGGSCFTVEWLSQPAPDGRVGWAQFNLPLNGEWSDVTATFDLLETAGGLCLALDDLHVL
jgi:hypothetical protein